MAHLWANPVLVGHCYLERSRRGERQSKETWGYGSGVRGTVTDRSDLLTPEVVPAL